MKTIALALALLMVALLPQRQAAGQERHPLAGKWHFVFETQGGGREIDADFTVKDGKVGGTFGKSQVKGTTTGDKFDLEFEAGDDEAGKGMLKMNGTIGAELTGSWSFQSYDGTFKATRPKLEKPAAQ
jgi:hypothetical protein